MYRKIALIIGGSDGIGRGIAEQLSSRNISTVIVGRRQLNEDHKKCPHVKYIQIDLTAPNAIEFIKNELGQIRLDYVVFSAATEAPLKRFSEITAAEYDYALSLNLTMPFFLVKALLQNFNTKARILFLTSRLSTSPEVGSLVYCMTKSAIEVFSAGLNKELNKTILASSIIPGIVDTGMQKRLREADPATFPEVSIYKEMQSKLQGIATASGHIVSHLCDTDDEEYVVQRVKASSLKASLMVSKL